MDQGVIILADNSEVGRQVDGTERLGGVEESTIEEEELQNEEETRYERLPPTETSANKLWSALGCDSVSAAGGEQSVGRKR